MFYSDLLFYSLLLLIAFLYASVGHGGASGYLALMAFYSFSPDIMRPTALLLNVFVSIISFSQFYRSGYFHFKLFWPFAIASIPAAFVGGLIEIDAGIYKIILACMLLLSVVKLVGFNGKNNVSLSKQNIVLSLIIGATIGLLSGIIGVGGGIMLSPVIILLNWADMKQTAAVSALFIFVNSLAGIAGLMIAGTELNATIAPMLCIALVGGLAGAWLGAKKFNSVSLKYVLSLVLIIAAVKLVLS